MSLWQVLVALVLGHFVIHVFMMFCLYLIPVGKFPLGAGYRMFPPDWKGRFQVVLGAVGEVLAFYFWIVTYPWGWVWTGKVELPLHTDVKDPRNAPLLLVHGFLMNRFCMVPLQFFLRRQGFRRIYTINLRHLFGPIEPFARQVVRVIHKISKKNEGRPVTLVGHSMGGVVGVLSLSDKECRDRLRMVISLGSPFQGTIAWVLGCGKAARQLRPGSVFVRRLGKMLESDAKKKLVSIYSREDRLALPPVTSRVEGALANIRVTGLGHMAMLCSPKVFRHVRQRILEGTGEGKSVETGSGKSVSPIESDPPIEGEPPVLVPSVETGSGKSVSPIESDPPIEGEPPVVAPSVDAAGASGEAGAGEGDSAVVESSPGSSASSVEAGPAEGGSAVVVPSVDAAGASGEAGAGEGDSAVVESSPGSSASSVEAGLAEGRSAVEGASPGFSGESVEITTDGESPWPSSS